MKLLHIQNKRTRRIVRNSIIHPRFLRTRKLVRNSIIRRRFLHNSSVNRSSDSLEVKNVVKLKGGRQGVFNSILREMKLKLSPIFDWYTYKQRHTIGVGNFL